MMFRKETTGRCIQHLKTKNDQKMTFTMTKMNQKIKIAILNKDNKRFLKGNYTADQIMRF